MTLLFDWSGLMMDIIIPPQDKVFEKWGEAVRPYVGDNYSYDEKSVKSTFPYMRLFDIDVSQADGDLEGNEAAIHIGFQVESYDSGQMASSTVKKLDLISHQAMKNMGFTRIFGGQVENVDVNIKRYISRYEMLYTGYLLNETL